jgi:hypothetical protein
MRGALRVLCAASPIPPRRLPNMEVRCTYPESGLAEQGVRKRHLGWRDPAADLSRSRAMSWPGSIGVPVALPTQICICSSRGTASKLPVIGMIASTCVEATVPFAAELAENTGSHREALKNQHYLAITTVVHELLSLGRSRFAAMRMRSVGRSPRIIGQ